MSLGFGNSAQPATVMEPIQYYLVSFYEGGIA